MPLTPTEIYGILNEKMDYLGYGPGNTPSVIDDSTIENVAALPDSQLSVLFHEINIALVDRWFSNGLNPSSKGLFRFIIRNEGEHGFTITDRFINLIEASPYPQTAADIAADLVGRADNPIEVHKYTDKYKPGRYKGTIDAQAFRKFLTPGGLVQYSAWIETNLFQSAEYGMMKRVAEMMKAAVEGDHVVLSTGVDMNTENGLCEVVENMMTCVDAYRQPTTLYNKGERLMSTPEEADVVIVTTPSRWNRVRARLYSDRYHLDQLYINGRVIEAPEGTDLGHVTVDGETEEVEFLVLDARGFCLEITTMVVKDFDVANMNYLNAFLHVEGVEGSVPTFCNCVAFTGSYGKFSPYEPEPAGAVKIPVFGYSSYVLGLTPTVKDADGNTITPVTITPSTLHDYDRMWIIPTESGTIELANAKSGGLRASDAVKSSVIAEDGTNAYTTHTSGGTITVPAGTAVVFLDNLEV